MTDDQQREIKLLCYAHWLLCRNFKTESGVRDIESLKNVVDLPGGGSLTCLLGKRLSSRKDLYSQFGWFVYYLLEGEPFNSKNKALIMLMLVWCLNHYRLKYKIAEIRAYIEELDIMRQGNSDISSWFADHCDNT